MAATKNHKHTLRSVLIFFAVFLVFFLTGFLFQFEAHAEGSNELNMIADDSKAYRAFLEWDPALKNGDIERATVLKLIMKKGEKVCLGTSVSGAPKGDILIRCQIDGKETQLKVNTSTKEGVIYSRQMEKAGPNYNGLVTDGYEPLYFEAPYTGVYELEFHSKGPSRANPTKSLLKDAWGTQGASVAAWDATVLDYDGNPVKGRLFTNYIALNTGTDEVGMYASLHILTSEGYQYNLETNGIGPWGFILYANNVGTLKGTTGQSLYKDVILKTDSLAPEGGAVVPTPDWHNKLSVLTHRIFFNDPDDEIATILSDFPIQPTPLSEISKFQFVGNMDDGDHGNKTEVGAGGVFHMTFSEHCTYDIIIDTDNNGKFDPLTDVMLPAAAAKGDNSLLWDGNDLSGNPLPEAHYNAQLRVHGGEFHFPMIDAERCPNGLKVNLMNPPSFLPASYDTTTVYYDSRNYIGLDGKLQEFDKSNIVGIPKPREALNGISSSSGAMGYGDLKSASATQFGNDRIIDIWSYILGDANDIRYQRTLDLEVVVQVGSTKHGAIMATVFFDADQSKIKESSEKTMEGVSVGLYKDEVGKDPVLDHTGTSMVSVSNGRGQVTFFDVPYNNPGERYYVLPGPVINQPVVDGVTHSVTTPVRSVTLNSANAYTDNIGLYSEHDVAVSVIASKAEITSGDEITFTIKVTNTKGFPANNTIVKIPVPNSNGEPEIVQCDQGSYANGKWTVGKLGANEEKTLVLKMKPIITESNISPSDTFETVTYKATASCDDDNDSTNNEASVSFNIKRKPEFQIIYHANYQPDAATPEATVTEERTTTDGKLPLRKNDFTRPDHDFLGWSTIKEIARIDYADQASYEGTGGSVVHLYAVWKQHTPDVSITMTASASEITAGQTVDLTVRVTNLETDPAKGVFVEIPLPNIEGSPTVSGSTTGVTYNPTAKKLTWNIGNMNGSESQTLSFKVMPVFAGGSEKTENFTGQTGCTNDKNDTNNEASVAVKVKPAANYKVSFDPNGGEGVAETEDYEYTTGGQKLKKNSFKKIGFVFMGWSTDPTATTPEYTDEQVYKGSAGSTVKLYAVWKAVTQASAGGGAPAAAEESADTGETSSATGGATTPVEQVLIPTYTNVNDVPDPKGADAPPVIRLIRNNVEKLFYKTDTPDGMVYRAEDGEVLGNKRSRAPWTGDSAKPLLWVIFLLLSAGGIAFTVIRMGYQKTGTGKARRKPVNRKKRKR